MNYRSQCKIPAFVQKIQASRIARASAKITDEPRAILLPKPSIVNPCAAQHTQ
ncbi:hypothetical protein LguiA_006899 [Lonicera macranthoides]